VGPYRNEQGGLLAW